MRLTYLTLQATSEGQAAHAHVHEIVSNLKKLGWEVTVVGPGDAAGIDVSLPRRLWRLLTTQMRLISYAVFCLKKNNKSRDRNALQLNEIYKHRNRNAR